MDKLESKWRSMIQRCENPKATNFQNYGGRGIKVCEEWHKLESFKKWALSHGYDENAPKRECTIDRINVNGDYCPENCRFISMHEQMKNKRNNRIIEIDGIKKPLTSWAEENGIPYQVIARRFYSQKKTGKDLIKPCTIKLGKGLTNFKEIVGERSLFRIAWDCRTSKSTLDGIIRGNYYPGKGLCRRLAKYFGMPEEDFACEISE